MDRLPEDDVFQFPCDFPIKVMGRDEPRFRAAAIAIVGRHAGEVPAAAIAENASRKGNFLSLTITIVARSRAQLDAIYRELSDHEDVLVVL